MTFKIIKDFLPVEVATRINKVFTGPFPAWNFFENAASPNDKAGHGYFHIKAFDFGCPVDFFSMEQNAIAELRPMIEYLNLKYIRRVKCNLYARTHKIVQHGKHYDDTAYNENFRPYDINAGEHPWSKPGEKTILYYVNSNDGYTEYFPENKKSIKVPSVFNTALYTDENILHRSSTCTDQPVRVTININFR